VRAKGERVSDNVTPEELNDSIETMRLSLAKALICRHLLRYLQTKVDDRQLELMRQDANYFAQRLRDDNDQFRNLPAVFVTLIDGGTLAIRFQGELS
jgi:hypothetical protein